jgi:hypothetical protein
MGSGRGWPWSTCGRLAARGGAMRWGRGPEQGQLSKETDTHPSPAAYLAGVVMREEWGIEISSKSSITNTTQVS